MPVTAYRIYTILTFGHNENLDFVMDTLSDVTSRQTRISKLQSLKELK